MPMITFIGVRISWLMLARKSDLRRVASSASSLAVACACSAAFCAEMSTSEPTSPATRPSLLP
ncbi:hypothetical protein D3C81_1333930 [compost metagenome]